MVNMIFKDHIANFHCKYFRLSLTNPGKPSVSRGKILPGLYLAVSRDEDRLLSFRIKDKG